MGKIILNIVNLSILPDAALSDVYPLLHQLKNFNYSLGLLFTQNSWGVA